MRIRIAANNAGKGFQSEVREALTDRAFSYEVTSSGFFRRKKVDSPLPGHPGSDIAALAIEKVLEQYDLVRKS